MSGPSMPPNNEDQAPGELGVAQHRSTVTGQGPCVRIGLSKSWPRCVAQRSATLATNGRGQQPRRRRWCSRPKRPCVQDEHPASWFIGVETERCWGIDTEDVATCAALGPRLAYVSSITCTVRTRFFPFRDVACRPENPFALLVSGFRADPQIKTKEHVPIHPSTHSLDKYPKPAGQERSSTRMWRNMARGLAALRAQRPPCDIVGTCVFTPGNVIR